MLPCTISLAGKPSLNPINFLAGCRRWLHFCQSQDGPGLRFEDLLQANPPVSQAKWAFIESSVNLDPNGNPDPYYVSLDLLTARHPQTLLATHHNGQPLTVEPGNLLLPQLQRLQIERGLIDLVRYQPGALPDDVIGASY